MLISRRIVPFIITFVIVLIIVSCSTGEKKQGEAGASLSIYLRDYDTNIKNAVYEFNKDNKNIEIKQTEFSSEQYTDYQERLKTELVSGNGPDIIYFKSYDLPELSKYMDKGMFYDLNSLIGKDKSFKLSDYNQKVIDCGIYKDKRYIIPLSYYMDAFVTTEQIIDDTGINIKDLGTSLADIEKKAAGYFADGSEAPQYFFQYLNLSSIVQNTKTSFADMENKAAKFASQEFINLLEGYKEIFKHNYPEDKLKGIISIKDTLGLLNDKQLAMIPIQLQGSKAVNTIFSAHVSEIDLKVYPQLSPDTDGCIMAKPSEFVAISAKCKNPEKAFEFIKMLLSEKYQSNELTGYIPVNTAAYEKEKKSNLGTNTAVREMILRLDGMIGSMETCILMDNSILDIVNEEIDNFLNGTNTAAKTAQSIQDKTVAYFNSPLTVLIVGQTSNFVDESTQEDKTEKQYISQLSIYYLSNQVYISNGIYMFNKKYPEIEIIETQFPHTAVDELRSKLSTSLMSGSGPDIIAFNWKYFNSLYKVIQNGTFCDLNEFIKNDSEFMQEDYFEEMWKWGVYNGKRYFVPLSMQMDVLSTTEKILKQNSISINKSGWTLKELQNAAKKFIENNSERDKYFFNYYMNFRKIIDWSGISFIDYGAKKSKFNSGEFIELLEIYKDIEPAISPEEPEKTKLALRLMNDGKIVMITDYITPFRLGGEYSAYNEV